MKSDREKLWRLIISTPSNGAMNMALDEAILGTVSLKNMPPTLRLYSWEIPCLSLGYAQPSSQADAERLRDHRWELVRRPTGGRAILHTDELTYAIAIPHDHPIAIGGVLESYRHLSRGLIVALQMLGLEVEISPQHHITKEERKKPVCFEVPSSYEITVQGKKLVGSAQVRRQHGVLQHGAIPLTGDITRICQVLRFESPALRQRAIERVRGRAATVQSLLGCPVTWQQVADALIEGFSNALGLTFQSSQLTTMEQERAQELVADRYTCSEWTNRI